MSIQYKFKFNSNFQFCLVCLFFPLFSRKDTDTDTSVFKNHTKAELLQLFAKDVLVMKKLEIEKTKPTFIICISLKR